jgi:N-hydroxyarylamine O-acetyltransferase
VFDIDAYLERIGLSGSPTLAQVHRAHARSIPFENLDPYTGTPVSLEIEDLQRKLVGERRGGYCFEQNLLLKAAAEAMGAHVEMYLGRVRHGAPPGVIRPRGHLILRIREERCDWHADVGFGLGTLFEPLPFGPGKAHEQSGWSYRIVREGPELVLQTPAAHGWADLYAFMDHPIPPIDVETINWWVCTNPRSPFVTGIVASVQSDDGLRTSLSDWDGLALTERTPTHTSTTPLERAEVPGLLAERFGLDGFAVGEDGRLHAPERGRQV